MGLLKKSDRIPTGPSTRYRDYTLTDYRPPREPAGRLHPSSLLRFALREAGLLKRVWPMAAALRRALGPDETVWGIKYGPAGFGAEFYFYNKCRNAPNGPKSASRIAEILAPFVDIRGRVDESLPYFMCSLELPTAARGRPCAAFRLYLGGEDGTSRGFSYRADGAGGRLENHYQFYDAGAPGRADAVRSRLASSPRCAGAEQRERLLPGYLLDGWTVCYAVKPRRDGLYFSRLDAARLARFLSENRPGPLSALLEESGDELAHLLWDVGLDFGPAESARDSGIRKISVYGVL